MASQGFEFRIAVIGNVSVGKTTIINALFRDKYGEVSMGRCTAGVNYFRLSVVPKKSSGTSHSDASKILKEVQDDNSRLRESADVEEKYFEIQTEGYLCEMRKDAKIVVVDLPGLNDACSNQKYVEYVDRIWDTFDCVVVVMDARVGVNTNAEDKLLSFVKDNLHKKKDVPLIILCNKVDDPDDEALAKQVKEVRTKVEEVFGAPDRVAGLNKLLNPPESEHSSFDHKIYPIFIEISAMHAFIYRTASRMSLEEFRKFDKDLIFKLGKEEVGRWQWMELSEDERYKITHRAVSDLSRYTLRLRATNFDKFLAALAYSIGGDKRQLQLIEKQLEVSLKHLSPSTCTDEMLSSILEKLNVLGKPADTLKASFWKVYDVCEKDAFKKFVRPNDVRELAAPMELLLAYHAFVSETMQEDEERAIVRNMIALFRRQVARVVSEASTSRNKSWRVKDLAENARVEWGNISPNDWKRICRSILLVAYNSHFSSQFGQEQLLLTDLLDTIDQTSCCIYCGKDGNKCCSTSPAHVVFFRRSDGILVPRDHKKYNKVFRIDVPESPSDPQHWGHIAWKFCQFMQLGMREAAARSQFTQESVKSAMPPTHKKRKQTTTEPLEKKSKKD